MKKTRSWFIKLQQKNELHDQCDVGKGVVARVEEDEIKHLKKEIDSLEYLLGLKIVNDQRILKRHRLRTIASEQLKNAPWTSKDIWIHECRALIKYFDATNEKDVQVAKSILMPIEEKYDQTLSAYLLRYQNAR